MNFVAAVKILAAVVYNKIDENTPCVQEYTNVMKCLHTKGNDVCFSCILDTVAGVQDNITFPDLVESNVCGELAHCASEKCDPGCSGEWSILHTCAETWEDIYAEDADICPGLGGVVPTKQPEEPQIMVEDFTLPFNYTNAGLETMPSC